MKSRLVEVYAAIFTQKKVGDVGRSIFLSFGYRFRAANGSWCNDSAMSQSVCIYSKVEHIHLDTIVTLLNIRFYSTTISINLKKHLKGSQKEDTIQ